MTLTGLLVPNDPQVGVAWLRHYVAPDLGNAGIATSLPKTLPSDGFITVRPIMAGIAAVDLPVHRPLLTFDFWAAPVASGGHVRWNAAWQLEARVERAMEANFQTFGKALDLGVEYMGARVQAVYKDTEPRQIENDPSAYARITLNVRVDWVVP